MKFIKHPSPNFDDRRGGRKPEVIIIHYTSMDSTEVAIERLCDPVHKVSCHYLIDEKGNVYEMVEETKRAWHAGVSSWSGEGDLNSRSIGIELSNRRHEPYTPEQLTALILLCQDLIHRHDIKPRNVIGHSDIAPDRKQDPGAHFPWEKMALEHGIGYWPMPSLRDKFNAKAAAKRPEKIKKLFTAAGYGVDAFGKDVPSFKELVTAFQRHFEPEVFAKPERVGIPTARTVAKLRALARKNKGQKP